MESPLRLEQLATRASQEFADLSDFVWKAPNLVESERQIELSKLERYSPDDREGRETRWKAESHRLDHVFPYLIAVGNLFALLSVFESYMLALCVDLQSLTGNELNNVRGSGINRLFKFLRQVRIVPEDVPLYEQVNAAIRIRNCVVHASGVLSWSHNNDELREIQRTGVYLSPQDRTRPTAQRGEYVYLLPSSLGDRISVRNEYCFILSAYLRTYFVALCENAEQVLASSAHFS
jgi:hypothetical protein